MQRQEQDRILFESALAKAMLEEVRSNQHIKKVLSNITHTLRTHVLPSAIKKTQEMNQCNDVNHPMKKVLQKWAIKHSKEDIFLGALLPQYSQEELINTPSGRSHLLDAIDKTLSIEGINKMNTLHDVISFIKTLDDMANYYSSITNSKEYDFIKDMIFPTPEELDMRFERPEKMLAITYGIGTEINKDLVTKDQDIEGCYSGKAKFIILSTENRKTAWFDKLSLNPKTGNPLPLIASASSSTARLLIMLLHLGAFNKSDGSFDLDMAQIAANCFMGYFVFCGHHSFLEVIEIWNRVLDYVAIYHPNTLPQPILAAVHIEEAMPYAKIGDYHSFLHKEYADNMMNRASEHSKNMARSYANLSLFSATANGDAQKLTLSENEGVIDAKAHHCVTLT